MADTIGGGINEDGSLQNTIVINEADLGKIDIVGLDNAGLTELVVNSPIKDLAIGLKGDQEIAIAGARIVDTVITNEAPKGETAAVTIAVTKAKNLVFETTGKGATDLSVPEGRLMKPTITTAKGKAPDSISFGAASTIKSADISTGKGADTITFNGRMKGKTTVESGKGKDVIEVNRQSGKGKLILSDFNKKDTLIVGDETFKLADIDDAPKFIKFDA